ncbi:acid protease [Hysterangium stoloniferum]|nr:acid protease [Hysterangium stoloniferum]
MHFTISFSVLFLAVVSLVYVQAAPTSKRAPGLITFPIRSLHGRVRGIHPQLDFQQQINRAERRLARMTGRDAPSDDHLRARLDKRMYIIGNGPSRLPVKAQTKRYNSAAKLFDSFKEKMASLTVAQKAAFKAKTKSNSTAGSNAGGVSPIDLQAAANGGLTDGNTPTASDSLALDIEGPDVGYVAQVQIGTPPKNFVILMDSGSADFWVGSENCRSEAGGGCGQHEFLGKKSSSTFVDTKAPFNVSYGTGNVAGTVIRDNVVLAGLQLTNHTFGTADTESVDFSSDSTLFDGLMGLAQSGLSEQRVPTPVESLNIANLIPQAITSYKISRLVDGKNDGEITFGGLDQTKFDSATKVTIPNVNERGFWEGDVDSFTVDGQDSGLQGRTAILDTGTTLIIAPAADAKVIHNLINGSRSDGQGGFIIPCTTNASVALTFGGRSFAIDPRDITPLPVDPADPTGDCQSGITSGNVGADTEWLVGDVFLKNAYFSTNVNENTISLAKLV